MSKSAASERLQQKLADTVIEAMLKHIPNWVDTLGASGKMSNKKVSPAVRVTAAKTGIDLVTKFIGSGTSGGGEGLLAQIGALEGVAPEEDDEDDIGDSPDTDGAKGGDRPESPEL